MPAGPAKKAKKAERYDKDNVGVCHHSSESEGWAKDEEEDGAEDEAKGEAAYGASGAQEAGVEKGTKSCQKTELNDKENVDACLHGGVAADEAEDLLAGQVQQPGPEASKEEKEDTDGAECLRSTTVLFLAYY